MKAATVAFESGADGVFLINQGVSQAETVALVGAVKHKFPQAWVGLNLLSVSLCGVLEKSYGSEWTIPDGIWTDGTDTGEMEAFAVKKKGCGWGGLVFGGVAFKYQKEVPRLNQGEFAVHAAESGVDVVTTSGPETGVAADLDKVLRFRAALQNRPLALASGITCENVEQYLPYVDAYLVATGIETSFGVLDPVRTKRLSELIHEYSV